MFGSGKSLRKRVQEKKKSIASRTCGKVVQVEYFLGICLSNIEASVMMTMLATNAFDALAKTLEKSAMQCLARRKIEVSAHADDATKPELRMSTEAKSRFLTAQRSSHEST